MLEFIRRMFGSKVAEEIGPPTAKTGNQWDEDDFDGHDTPLAVKGGPEFVSFCIKQGTCKLDGEVLEKFKEIIKKYPIPEDDEECDDDYDAQDRLRPGNWPGRQNGPLDARVIAFYGQVVKPEPQAASCPDCQTRG